MNAFSQGKDVVDIAMGSADHTTLVAAVKAADPWIRIKFRFW